MIAYAESVLDKTTKTQKAGEVLYTELENISFAAEIKKMKGYDMLLAEVRFYFVLFYFIDEIYSILLFYLPHYLNSTQSTSYSSS